MFIGTLFAAPTSQGGGGPPIVSTSLTYLGTCEKAPKIVHRPAWKPVFNDIGGTEVPFDVSYQGEEAFTFADLTRWNEPVFSALQARPNFPGDVRGLNIPGDIGTLMLTEGRAYQLFIFFPYVAKPAYASGGMPAGYRFVATFLEGPDELSELGTSPRKINLIFHHIRGWDPKTQRFVCYDHAVGAMPAIN